MRAAEYVVRRGASPLLSVEEARNNLLALIQTTTLSSV